jgi:hypothetical protein
LYVELDIFIPSIPEFSVHHGISLVNHNFPPVEILIARSFNCTF